MTYAQLFKGLDQTEKDRRLGVVIKMNALWDKMNSCNDKDKRKRISERLDTIRRQETSWLKEPAWFLY